MLAEPLQRLGVPLKLEPLDDADLIAPHRQRPLARVGRIELTDGAGGRVARVHERGLAGRRAALVQGGEVGQRHIHLTAHLQQRRHVVDPQRDRADRAQVVRDVLPHLAVAPRGPALQHARAVDETDRQAVYLRLDHEPEPRHGDALAREMRAHPLHPGPQLLLGASVRQREHRLQVLDLLQLAHRLAAHALGGRVGGAQPRVLGLDRAQLVQ